MTNDLSRIYAEADDRLRNPLQRDLGRIIHSKAFRRLKHKTQVFLYGHGDHVRTRLTHTLEVAQVARALARALNCDETLAEITALSHDLGHPPFGHVGENILNDLMKQCGGFAHNDHTVRLVTYLENQYLDFDGLNLTRCSLSSIAKHNGPILNPSDFMIKWSQDTGISLTTPAPIEGQIAAIADDIAYLCHDVDDGLRSGLLHLADVIALPLVGDFFMELQQKYHASPADRIRYQALRQLMNYMIDDVYNRVKNNSLAMFSDELNGSITVLRTFLMQNMYLHPNIIKAGEQAKVVLCQLFDYFMHNNNALPADIVPLPINIGHYIAGMTDQYALSTWQAI